MAARRTRKGIDVVGIRISPTSVQAVLSEESSITSSRMTRSSGRINQAVEIKKVSHGNIKDFLDLIEGLARFENRAPLEDAAKRRLEIDALAENPPFETFLAYRNDRPVGYVISTTPTPLSKENAYSSWRTSSCWRMSGRAAWAVSCSSSA